MPGKLPAGTGHVTLHGRLAKTRKQNGGSVAASWIPLRSRLALELELGVTKARIVPLPRSFITYVCVDCCKTTMLVHGIKQ